MANHVRQQVREAVAVLLTGLTTTAANVFQSRVHRLADDELPGLVVLTNNEILQVASFNINPALERTLALTVIGLAKANSDLDVRLDTIIKEVEQAINASVVANTLNGLVKSIVLESIAIDMNGDNEKPIGQAVMNFSVVYFTMAAAPDVSI